MLYITAICDRLCSTGANPLLTKSEPHLDFKKQGNILINSAGEAGIPGVFTGGDMVKGCATVIIAMGDGKRAAAAIDEYLKKK